jgi:ligand-binding SRPBCC domain-containing protein
VKAATITVTSRVRAPVAAVWEHATTMAGVNLELMPLVRMTVPASARGKTLSDVELGSVAFHSVLLAFGVVPFDRHALCLVRVDANRGFQERSTSLLQKRWDHDRTLAADGEGTLVTDQVTFAPRIGPAKPVAPIIRAIFRHRHKRLAQRFGG